MAQNALAIWDWRTLGGPLLGTPTGLKFFFFIAVRDTVTGKSDLIKATVDVASDATGAQIITACTDAVVAAASSAGYTIPRTSVRLPGFTTGV